MGITNRGWRLSYHPSLRAEAQLAEWEQGCVAEFVVDDTTGQPAALRLKPAAPGERGFNLRVYDTKWPFLSIPTRRVGMVVQSAPQAAEEVEVSPSVIEVRIPFEFRITDARRDD
jgi:hypothetical protein